ncbi:MAG: NADH-quinone oxidoreductase subunit C [Oscillospiraceae bacterium]
MKEDVMESFGEELRRMLGAKFSLKWDVDKKGVVCGWCRLDEADDIYSVAEAVKSFSGRVMTISPLNTPNVIPGQAPGNSSDEAPKNEEPVKVVINYHFYFQTLNLTVCITLPDDRRAVKSITPVLISADWHEREMRELYNIDVQGHPNSKKLFLDESIHMTDHTMIPLSEALKGASTSTLWEKIMKSGKKEENAGE